MSKLTTITADELTELLTRAKARGWVKYSDVPADTRTSDATVTLPEQIISYQDGEYLALYADQPGAVSYQYLEDLLNDHSIQYGDDAHEWLSAL